jgi:hypothetical protein
MIVWCFSMQGRVLLIMPLATIMCLHFSMQEEGIHEHSNAKCHFRTTTCEKSTIDHCVT